MILGLSIASLMFLIHQVSAFFMQASEEHEWILRKGDEPQKTFFSRWAWNGNEDATGVQIWLWSLNRKPKEEKLVWYLDWIPRDGYHIVLSCRNNLGWLAGVTVAVTVIPSWPDWGAFASAATLYATTRGVGFTLLMKLFRGSTT